MSSTAPRSRRSPPNAPGTSVIPIPGGQSYVQVGALTRSLLRDLAAYWDGKRVLLIAHSANRWALEHLLHGRSLEELVDAPFEWQPGGAIACRWAGPASSPAEGGGDGAPAHVLSST